MPELGKATYTLELNTTPYDTGLVAAEAKADAATSSIAGKFTKMGTKVSHHMERIGSKMTKVLTVPILAVGIAAGTMAFRFEKSMDKISALVGVGEKQMHEYHDAVLEMVDVVGKGPKELADALYFITSAGFKGESALRVLEASAKASAAGLGETEIIADAVTSAVNAYGEAALSAASATDIMLAAVREGKTEPAEFASSIGRVIAPANLLGVSFDEVSAAIAAMSLQGLDAAESTTALRGVLLTFARPTVEAVKALKSLGEESGLSTAAQVRASIANEGLLETMIKLKAAFGDNVEGLTAVFGNVRAFVGGQILTGETLAKNERIFAKINGTIGDTDAAFDKVSKTAAFKLDKAMASIEKSLTILGGTILPMAADALAKVAGQISKLGDAFNKLSPEAKKAIIIIAAVAAFAGPILLFLGAMVGAITALVGAFSLLAPAVAFVLTPMGALVIAIVALVGAMIAAKVAPESLAKGLEKLGLSAEQAAAVVEILAFTFDAMVDIIKFNVQTIVNAVQLGMSLISAALDIVIGLLTLDFGQAWDGIKALVMAPLNFVVQFVKNWATTLWNIFDGLWVKVKKSVLEAVLYILKKLDFKVMGHTIIPGVKSMIDGIERELAKLDAGEAGEKAVVKWRDIVVPGFEKAGTAAGEAYMTGVHGVIDPGFEGVKAQAEETGNFILSALQNPFDIFATKPLTVGDIVDSAGVAEAVWDGKLWRDKQGKVLKEQSAAWDAYNAKMKRSIISREKPDPGDKVYVPSMKDKPPKTGTKPPGGDETGSGIVPYDMQIAMEAARQTPGDADDLKILRQQESFLEKLLTNRKLSRAKRLEIMQELTGVINEINGITDSIAEAVEKELVLIPPKLQQRQARAAQTEWLGDDLARAKDEKKWLKDLLKQKGFNAEQKQQIRMALIAVDGKIADINKQITDKLSETPVLWTAKMRIRATKAERTESLKDDLKVQKDELAYLKKLLKNKKLDLEQRATIMEEITRVLAKIKELNKEIANTAKDHNDEMKKLAFNIMGERAGFFATFGSNAFTQVPGEGGTQRTPGTGPGITGSTQQPTPPPATGPTPSAFAKGGIVKKPKYYAVGGGVDPEEHGRGVPAPFIPKGTDTVPAMLTPGELVLNKGQIATLAKALGTGNSAQSVLNALKKLKAGPSIPAPAPARPEGESGRDKGTGPAVPAATKTTATTIQAQLVRINTPKAIFETEAPKKTSPVDVAAKPRMVETGEKKASAAGVVIEHFENVQNFEQPTPDRNREARMAKLAVESVFDQGSYHG